MCGFQYAAGMPSDSTMTYAASANSIRNSPITKRDIHLSADMLGPSRYAAKGKITRKHPDAVDVRSLLNLDEICVQNTVLYEF